MVSRTAAEDAVRNEVKGPERGDLIFFLGEQTDDELSKWRILDADGDAAIVAFVRRKAQAAAAGQGVGSAAGAAAASGLGVGSTAGAGGGAGGAAAATGAAAGPGSGSTAAGGAAGLHSTSEVGGLEEVISPSSLYNITFTLFNGSHLATTLVSHAKALGFRGRVRHLSGSRSDFTLLLSAAENGGWQKLASFVKWVADQVPLHKSAVEAEAAGTSTAEGKAACAVVTSNLAHPCTSDRALLDLYKCGQLSVSSTPTVQLALEQAVRVAEQEERLSQFSLGKSSASSAQE